VAAAIVHDSGESRSGDIPTPAKKKLRRAFGAKFDDLLAEFDVPMDVDALGRTIIKCADYLESMIFLEEHQVGRHANAVMVDIMDDAGAFFGAAGEPGRISNQIWSEWQNARYEF
jgi:5'-deoxynucleotidase YfbR-like HD superfamily hydrolase